MGSLSIFLAQFVFLFFQVLSLAILFRVLLSWVDPMNGMRLSQILHEITEPILAPIRRFLPSIPMFDISPIIAMLLLQALSRLLQSAMLGSI